MAVLTLAACTSSGGGSTGSSGGGGNSAWLGAFTPEALPPPVHAVRAVDCPTASRCWAVGSAIGTSGSTGGAAVIATADGGATWTQQTIPTTVGFLSAISCSDVRHCTAVGQADQATGALGVTVATADGGATWSILPSTPGALDITAVSCLPTRRCTAIATLAGGPVALTAGVAGAAWVQRGALPSGFAGATSLSCTSAADCWATAHTAIDTDHVAGAVATTTDGGAIWNAAVLPKLTGTLDAISCVTGAVDGNGSLPASTGPPAAVPNSGTTGPAATGTTTTIASSSTTTNTSSTIPSTTPTTRAPVVGVAGVRCTAVGSTDNTISGTRAGRGLVLTTANGGANWSVPTVTATSAALLDVSCPAVDACVAVGASTASAAQAGVVVLTGTTAHPWTQASTVLQPQPLTAVDCTSNSQCLVAGESISEHLAGG